AGVAHLRPVERDPHHRQVPDIGAPRLAGSLRSAASTDAASAVDAPVVGDVGETTPGHLPPAGQVADLRHLVGQDVSLVGGGLGGGVLVGHTATLARHPPPPRAVPTARAVRPPPAVPPAEFVPIHENAPPCCGRPSHFRGGPILGRCL